MHTGKRTRNIRLKDLKTAYLEQLRERSRARMEEYLQHHTVLESELEECIWDYYRQLLLFVAVPLPGTGAWTGALIAALLNLRLKLAVPAITAGVFLAGIIISLLTYGAAALL